MHSAGVRYSQHGNYHFDVRIPTRPAHPSSRASPSSSKADTKRVRGGRMSKRERLLKARRKKKKLSRKKYSDDEDSQDEADTKEKPAPPPPTAKASSGVLIESCSITVLPPSLDQKSRGFLRLTSRAPSSSSSSTTPSPSPQIAASSATTSKGSTVPDSATPVALSRVEFQHADKKLIDQFRRTLVACEV
eukprot:CAMPEP_0185253188 /NCGR_PEP_ID=MMETSP1359-20130426/2044_1 /TAXON_ID=552665 /ORGANISM="Bigelowiella longifila, Strain CCMP242" /LENGTH=189 /DNA_ID=CAMNT_0027835529 /DNA_START=1 /DNA_END=570 /DNA_ORIENTATION=-